MSSSTSADAKSGGGKVTHVIFDMDGTLLDTESIYEAIHVKLCEKFGKNLSDPEMLMKLLGKPTDEGLQMLIDELKIPATYQEFHNEYERIARSSFFNLQPMKGAEKLIRHLKNHQIPMAIATNSERSAVDMKAKMFNDLFTSMHHIVTVEDVKKGKPDPEIYLLAASKFDTPQPAPENCLVFEDSRSGMRAAIAAEMKCIMIPDPRLPKDDLKRATLVLDSLEDFKPEDFGLPPF